MNNLKFSWRLSRIGECSAWRRLLSKAPLIVVMFVFLILCLILFNLSDKGMFGLALFMAIICGYIILKALLGADDYYVIQMGKERCKIWVYKNERTIKCSIFFKAQNWEKSYDIAFYDKDILFDGREAFLFSVGFDWYLANKHYDKPQNIGMRYRKYIYCKREKENGKLVLNLLNGDNFETIKVDECITENICVPYDVWANQSENANQELEIENIKKFIILKDDNHYRVLGYANAKDENPRLINLTVPSLIFKEGNDVVILAYDNDKSEYKELYRKLTLMRKASTLIFEPLPKKCNQDIYGRVLRFDTESLELQDLYEGPVTAINFVNGEILTPDGQYFEA